MVRGIRTSVNLDSLEKVMDCLDITDYNEMFEKVEEKCMSNQFNIFSMFDGVGGFIVGLDNANKKFGEEFYKTTYSNQFEPSRKAQDAFEVGVYRFPEMNHSNQDIMEVPNSYFDEMKENGVNMIVGGFPARIIQ